MYPNILNNNQKELLSILSNFINSFYLVGGTAIALQIGHRQSLDFDLFCRKKFNSFSVKKTLNNSRFKLKTVFEDGDQIQGIIHDTRLTFYEYPYDINPNIKFDNIFRMPTLLELAAMKAYALRRGGKWKDYVDLYFILKDYHNLNEISKKAEILFQGGFNEKLFRQQLCYFKDINYSEAIEYVCKPVSNGIIENFLIDVATSQF